MTSVSTQLPQIHTAAIIILHLQDHSIGLFSSLDIFITSATYTQKEFMLQRFSLCKVQCTSWSSISCICVVAVHLNIGVVAVENCRSGADTWSLCGSPLCVLKHAKWTTSEQGPCPHLSGCYCILLHCISLHYIASHYIALNYIASHCNTVNRSIHTETCLSGVIANYWQIY